MERNAPPKDVREGLNGWSETRDKPGWFPRTYHMVQRTLDAAHSAGPRSLGILIFSFFAVVEASLSVATAIESSVFHVLLNCPAGFATGSPCAGFVGTGVPNLLVLAPLLVALGSYVGFSDRVGITRTRAIVVLFSALVLMLLGQGVALTALAENPETPTAYTGETIATAQLVSLLVFALSVVVGTVSARQ